MTNLATTEIFCPQCNTAITDPLFLFCPMCSAKLNVGPVGIGKQIYIYCVSLIAPPFGLVWTFKYMKSNDTGRKRIGMIALILTIISIIATIWFSLHFIQSFQEQLNSYQSLGL